MANVRFLLVLPTNPDESDRMNKFTIVGTMRQQPNQFSINFVNSPNCTDNITYHFKVRIPTQTIIENYKSNGEWSSSHQETILNIFDESAFSLEFRFDYDDSTIHVYQGQGHNFVTKFETLFSLSEIQSIQVWGDVQKINQFSLSYD
ncbi:uncharacterized protein LOC6563850 isoform X2 [Drosophila grimshawi]|uniref:Galectin n=1 Tax=Drosophila grimshawi TaxID=7222 RepID=B4JHC5_DROGR|nr:uncharacterized protein LOC6563850 isoform X2 [Drosophila grimshawi]XP_032593012.1 uncharacterized protein LOC6563850 isoform X2 [Drosophila grimshawi]XP_032593013.1 uncharacterized protein LOC6563850 isoform X2 [Drosophila grimshawi]XP_032593014.1 uncharacterized protein LOC6563850 isoform X2 [Drosophila grimshawi]EDV93832.1 GH18076 [Drosophila grimshawi]